MDPNLIILICALVFGAIITVITSIDTLHEDSGTWAGRNWKKISIVLCFVALVWITSFQYDQAKTQKLVDKTSLDSTRKASDSSIQAGIDSGNNKLFKNLSVALGKQNLKLDSVTNELVKIKNDTARRAPVIYGPDPVITLCTDSSIVLFDYPQSNLVRFKINVCANQAAAKKIGLSAYIVGEDNLHNLVYLGVKDIATGKVTMDNHTVMTGKLTTSYVPTAIKYYFLIRGSYFDIRLTKRFFVDELFLYDMVRRMSGTVALKNVEDSVMAKIPLTKK
jgi:hypothetical protein